MEFNKAYNRQEFINFLQNSFLPEDFISTLEIVPFITQMHYSTKALKLGTSSSLDLVAYEIKHTSTHDARVALSKEAFRLLADENEDRALVIFVPEDDNSKYRFSFIEITIDIDKSGTHISRSYSNPHRYSYLLGKDIAYYTPNKYLNEKGRVLNDEDLHNRFSVEVLTKEFYNELSDWYAWAIKIIRFPNDINDNTDDDKYNNESAIRLITRLIFVWFLKQRHLIPNEFFDEKYIAENLIEGFNPHVMVDLFSKSKESKYYKAILQNLFFAMLNSPITAEGSNELSERRFRKGRGDYDNNKLMRYKDFFRDPQLFVNIANNTVPFLNGGLFDCLDDKDNGMYYDGFSDRDIIRKSLIVPDYLFFGEEVGKNIDLSEWYGNKKKKKVSALGIIDILKRYNFTVEENTPFDKEVSLDPELLGKVFENLLAAFNPETKTTARKQTGSFYTPREIVQYMVNESLVAHLKRTVGEELEPQYRELVQYTDDKVDLTKEQHIQILQSLYNCKILDPACGSGAFPMGILQQMVHILNRIDPDNEQWKEMMLNTAINETSEAYHNASDDERKEMISDIERSFDENVNRPDYARKLYLIENCIYGIDIQPIAIQISKLRFFISLVVDQKTNKNAVDNFGIRPLPNLEAKFVAANTLIGLKKKDTTLWDTDAIKAKEQELKSAKHKIFGAKTYRTKRKYRQIVKDLRAEIATMLEKCGAIGNTEAQQLAQWDMFDQNSSSPFFDPEWMFGIMDGFDIVIGNPPYVLISSKTYNNNYKRQFSYQEGKKDLYRMFIEIAVCSFVKRQGVLSYITPNTFLTIPSCKSLRKLLLTKTTFLSVSNYHISVFESSVNSVVFILNVYKYKSKTEVRTIDNKFLKIDSINFDEFLENEQNEIYLLSNYEISNLLSRIQKSFISLDKISEYNICLGAQVYHNTLHTQLQIKKKFLHSNYKVNDNYIQDFGGKNILRYGFNNVSDKWVDFSAEFYIKPNEHFFKDPRLLLREISGVTLTATYTTDLFMVNKSVYCIIHNQNNISDLYFLLAILNSRFIGAYVNAQGDKADQKIFPRITMRTLKSIPIPYANIENKKMLYNLVERILKSKRENTTAHTFVEEQEIDSLVYHLYGLTYDEVMIVDPKTPITKDEYNK